MNETTDHQAGSGHGDLPDGATQATTDEGPRVDHAEMKDLSRLRRSSTDKYVAGVAGGIARHFDIDPIIVRILLVVLTFFGGAGLLVYGAVWLFAPDDATGSAVISVDARNRGVVFIVTGVIAGLAVLGDSMGGWQFPGPFVVLIVVALLAVVFNVMQKGQRDAAAAPPGPEVAPEPQPGDTQVLVQHDVTAPPPPAAPYTPPPGPTPPKGPHPKGPLLFFFTLALLALGIGITAVVDVAGYDVSAAVYPLVTTAIVGAMLVLGSFFGRAGGLILLGLVSAMALLVTSVTSNVEAGTETHRPLSAATVESEYTSGVGEVILDLSDISDPAGLRGRSINVVLTAGQTTVILPPEGVDVDVTAHIRNGGEIVMAGDNEPLEGGHGVRQRQFDRTPDSDGTDVLDIDVTSRVGQIVIKEQR